MKLTVCWNWLGHLLPPACSLCGGAFSHLAEEPFCPGCMATIICLPQARCSCCALPFASSSALSPHLCGRCVQQLPAYAVTYAAALYQGPLRSVIGRFKFQQHPNLDRPLAGLLLKYLPAQLDVDLLVPVPLHPFRLRERTYNQALLLARELGRVRRLPTAHDVLGKCRSTSPQQSLSAAQRRVNLRGAFVLNRDVRGKKILLVDDVMTTGVTVDLCSQVLLAGGAARVDVAVVARAPLG
ncbi:ComF family protein [Pelovirga terrestris]|uniref:ComF family protein n=1 Tax=Pelovirga terrestris TaxID=2771352 RepID=A0A8J6QM88_9BACT|nr:ComF family protein [Pelovirga terrestris]MBD1401179.1 ComF family protein [Pelovirga terrestris]